MSKNTTEPNPYQSPAVHVLQDELPSGDKQSKPRWFRWRVIPVTLLYIFGGMLLVAGVARVVILVWLAFRERIFQDAEYGYFLMALTCSSSLLYILAGSLAVVAGRAWWKGRWLNGWLAFLLFLLLYASVVCFMF